MEYEKHPAGEYVLDTAAAAAEIPCSPNTLKKWRCTGEHIIPYIKPAGRCFYHPADIAAFKLSTWRTHTD